MKKKITVRFVVEQDFEVQLKEGVNSLGSWMSVGDIMVSSGRDCWGDTFEGNHIFENPVSDLRGFQGRHLYDANLYNITNEPVSESGAHAWLLEDEKEVLWGEEEPDDDNVVPFEKGETNGR